MKRVLLAVLALLPLAAPPGRSIAELGWRLDDDLEAGAAGAIPLALLEGLCELRPGTFGRTTREAYDRFGWLHAEGRELPIGATERRILGVRVRNYNCLACHAGESEGRLVVGMTNRTLDFAGFYRAVILATRDVVKKGELAKLIARARRHRLARHESFAPQEAAAVAAFALAVSRAPLRRMDDPPYGPGRTIVAGAYRAIRFDMDPGPYAPVKVPDLFGVRARTTLLWTGNEKYSSDVPPEERIARNGLLVPWVQAHPLTGKPVPDEWIVARLNAHRTMAALLAASAPPPAPSPRDRALHAHGRTVFRETCARCHGEYAQEERDGRIVTTVADYDEKLVPVAKVGTDPAYERANDHEFMQRIADTPIGALYDRVPPSGTYVARPLLGVRLRFPYLHNGSVPNLRALLTPPEERPRAFHVGADAVLDEEAVGYSSTAAPRGPRAKLRDVTVPGNRAQGHPFGTTLPDDEKRALIAYLRTL